MYVPNNIYVYCAAFAGAIAGLASGGRYNTDPNANDYSQQSAAAGAYAQEFDTAWGPGAADTFQVETIQSASNAYWRDRAPWTNPKALAPSFWAVSVDAIIATIVSSENYLAAQGITPPPYPPGGGGGATEFTIINAPITAGQSVKIVGNNVTLSSVGDYLIGGIALQSGAVGHKIAVNVVGPIDPTVLNLGAGKECSWGFDASSNVVRLFGGTAVSGLAIGGRIDAFGNVTVASRRAEYFDVKDYGAAGDSVTDDTTAFQRTLDAIPPGPPGGGKAYAPAGLYILTNTLVASTLSTLIEGAGQNATILWYTALVDGIHIRASECMIEKCEVFNNACAQFENIANNPQNYWHPSTNYTVGTIIRSKQPGFRLLQCTRTGTSGAFKPFGAIITGSPNAYSTSNPGISRTDPVVKLTGAPIADYPHVVWVTTAGAFGVFQWYWSVNDYATVFGPFPSYEGINKYPLGPTTTCTGPLAAGILPVVSTLLAVATGTIIAVDNGGTAHLITYTGTTPTSFTGCTVVGGGSPVFAAGAVQYSSTGLYANPTEATTTTVGVTANGASTINVVSTANFTTSAGAMSTNDSTILIGGQVLSYGGITPTSFTDVTGWAAGGPIAGGSAVEQTYPQGQWASPAFNAGFSHVIGDIIDDGTTQWQVINGPVGIMFGGAGLPSGPIHCKGRDLFVSGWITAALMANSETSTYEDSTIGGQNAVWISDGNSYFCSPTDAVFFPATANVNVVNDCDLSCYSAGFVTSGGITAKASNVNFEAAFGFFSGGHLADSWNCFYYLIPSNSQNTFIDTTEGEGGSTAFYLGQNTLTGTLGSGGTNLQVTNAYLLAGNGPYADFFNNIGFGLTFTKFSHCDLFGGDISRAIPVFSGIAPSASPLGLRVEDCAFPLSSIIYDNEPIGIISYAALNPKYGSILRSSIGIGCWPGSALDIRGNMALRAVNLTFTAGIHNDVTDDAASPFYYASEYETVPNTGAVVVTGLKAGVDGQILKICNLSGHSLTFMHQSTLSSAVNRIIVSDGQNLSLTPASGGFDEFELRYSAAQQRWLLEAGDRSPITVSAGASTLIAYDAHLSTGTYPSNVVTTTLTAAGGSGSYTWSMLVNASGGSVNAGSGVYTAGNTPGTDVVGVTDSLGNSQVFFMTVRAFLYTDPGTIGGSNTLEALYDLSINGSFTVTLGLVTAMLDQSGTGDANKNLAPQNTGATGPAYTAMDAAYNNTAIMSYPAASATNLVPGSGTAASWAAALSQANSIFFVGQSVGPLIINSNNANVNEMTTSAGSWEAANNGFVFTDGSSAVPSCIGWVSNGVTSKIYNGNSQTANATGTLGALPFEGIALFGLSGFGFATSGKLGAVAAYTGVLNAGMQYEVMKKMGVPRGFTIT